jgi:hypothetical protein
MLDAQSLAVEKMQPLQIRLFEEISAMIQTQQASTTSAAAASTASARASGDAPDDCRGGRITGDGHCLAFYALHQATTREPAYALQAFMKLLGESGHPDYACSR